jgi:uncharacterized membrane protein
MTRPASVDRLIGRILLVGGLASVALIVVGLAIYAAQDHPQARELVRVIHNRAAGRPPDVFTSLGDVRRALAQRPPDPLAVTALGLVCLLVTPVVGVAAAIVGFVRARDRDYAVIAGVVLGMLLLSFALAAGG